MCIGTLTDADCWRATPNQGKLRKLFDGHGLMLAVLPSGNKVWRLAYWNEAGKQQTAVIGPYPLIGLKEARKRRDALRLKWVDGHDIKTVPKPKPSITLDVAIEQYWTGRTDITDGYKSNALRAFAMYVSPALGAKPVREIAKDELMDALRLMDAAGLSMYVRRVRMWVGQVLDWSVQHGHANTNPASTINSKVAFSRKSREGFASLALAEVHPFMSRLAHRMVAQTTRVRFPPSSTLRGAGKTPFRMSAAWSKYKFYNFFLVFFLLH